MNLDEAREESIKMWTWIRDHAGERFSDSSYSLTFQIKKLYARQYPKAASWEYLCALCEVLKDKQCKGCPLSRGRRCGCEDYGEAYFSWRHLPISDVENQRLYAQQIVNDVTAWRTEAVS